MLFKEFAECCEALEKISGRLDKIDLLSRVLGTLTGEELEVFVRFIMGRIFPEWSQKKTGIGPNNLFESIAYIAGIKKEDVIDAVNRSGDVGSAVENLLANKEQMTFFTEDLELLRVYRDLEKVAESAGKRSQRHKTLFLKSMLSNASPKEGKYLARLMLEELRIGVGGGNIRESISRCFDIDAGIVEHSHQVLNDLGEVARLAKQGEEALKDVRIRLFRPVRMMLAKQGSVHDTLKDNGTIVAEYKYDGVRFQFHKKGDKCRIYSRKLEEVSTGLPDMIEALENATDGDVILDGEIIAVRDDRPLPFQYVIRRFRRKHGVYDKMESIELKPNVFDILYIDGETLLDTPFINRRKILEKTVKHFVTPQFILENEEDVESVYNQALESGHEGLMLKVPESPYTPGVRGKLWIKIKPEVDTMDLVITGAEWGEGKRAQIYGSFMLACRDDEGKLLPVSKVATGFSDDILTELYEILKDKVISSDRNMVSFEPEIVLEIGYEEIQASKNYESGYALRFPRLIRIRYDKDSLDIEHIESLTERFDHQKKVI